MLIFRCLCFKLIIKINKNKIRNIRAAYMTFNSLKLTINVFGFMCQAKHYRYLKIKA